VSLPAGFPNNQPPAQDGAAPHEPVEVGRVQPVRVAVSLPRLTPYVTYTILGVTIAMFLLQMASQYLLNSDALVMWGAKINEYIRQGQVWRFFTPVLLHANLTHIAFNMYAMYSIGRELERFYGHGRFLLLYGIGAFAGNVASFWMSANPSVGASTALFGMIAAEGVFIYQNRRMFGDQARRMLTNVILIVVVNLGLGLMPMIDNWGHLGGLIGGAVFAWFAGPQMGVVGNYPDLKLADKHSVAQITAVAALETAAIAALALAGMLR
jgi:rhomboid protease GluP